MRLMQHPVDKVVHAEEMAEVRQIFEEVHNFFRSFKFLRNGQLSFTTHTINH